MEGPKGGSCRAWLATARGSLRLLLCVAALAPTVLAANQIKGLDDAIMFRLNWAGGDSGLLDSPDYEKLVMMSSMNERYECLVPIKYGDNNNKQEFYKGPSPLALLMPLFKQQSCNLRLDRYWTYELCHGRYIKQYREEREGKTTRLLEFTLGIITEKSLASLSEQAKTSTQEIPVSANIPTTKIEGLDTPYFMVNYTHGSICDVTGQPRTSHVLFVCYEEGQHDIYSIKEIYSCEYEIVILSPILCQHPLYRSRELPQTYLHCIPMEGSPKRPRNLLQIEAESLKLRSSDAILAGDTSSGSVKLKVLDDEKEDTTTTTSSSSSSTSERRPRVPLFSPQPAIDQKLVEDFLNGDYCLHGGSRWWKYEFCHGRKVEQYHEEQDGTRTSILLGYFNMENHKKWITQNPEKSYKPGKRQVSHFYSGGTTCDVTGAPRQVEVKLKCKESNSPSSMAVYLQEPRTCEYVLVVETSIVCPLLQHADHLGWFSAALPPDAAQITKELSSSSSGSVKHDSHKGTVELAPIDEDEEEDDDYDDE